MTIKTKLTVNFTIIVCVILICFSACIYYFSNIQRDTNFNTRLHNKAITTFNQFIVTNKIDFKLQQLIDSTTINMLSDYNIFIFNDSNKLIYSNHGSLNTTAKNEYLLKSILPKQEFKLKDKNKYLIGFSHNYKYKEYKIIATAVNYTGPKELHNLGIILLISLALSFCIIFIAGIFNAQQSLKPIADIIYQISHINASRLHERIIVKNKKDEMGQLAEKFNRMLSRIETSFKLEREFVSSASHELRTPLTTINGEIEVALLKPRTVEEYQTTLNSVFTEIQNLTIIINGFLQLTEASMEEARLEVSRLRIDEKLFQVKDEFLKLYPTHAINIEFEKTPTDESQVTIQGNAYFIKILIRNLIENAFKFSETHKMNIKINFNQKYSIIKFEDHGIGIPEHELTKIFTPFYRAENARHKKGHGIGLSIVEKIVTIHKGYIAVNSQLNMGTTFIVQLPLELY